jgi:hypothetical protein
MNNTTNRELKLSEIKRLLVSDDIKEVTWGLRFSLIEFKHEPQRLEFIADTYIEMLNRESENGSIQAMCSILDPNRLRYFTTLVCTNRPLFSISLYDILAFDRKYHATKTPAVSDHISNFYYCVNVTATTIRYRFNEESMLKEALIHVAKHHLDILTNTTDED